jgi:cysteine synthase A
VLVAERPETRIVVCEPQDAALNGSGEAQTRKPDGSPSATHPAWKPHPVQGWMADFIPKITGDAMAESLMDELLAIPAPDAIRCSRELAQKEGIFVGITAGGTLAGALRVAEKAEAGATILAMLSDTGERYLSTPLFADIPAEMTPEEEALLATMPG